MIEGDTYSADDELSLIEKYHLRNPDAPGCAQILIQELLNPVGHPQNTCHLSSHFLPPEFPTVPISHIDLVNLWHKHNAGTNVNSECSKDHRIHETYQEGKISLNHAAHQLCNSIDDDQGLRKETVFQKLWYKCWVTQGPVWEWHTGCHIFEVLSDVDGVYYHLPISNSIDKMSHQCHTSKLEG